MKKSTVVTTVVITIGLMVLVGIYAYFMQRERDRQEGDKMSDIQIVLSRDLKKDYPPTVKEVVKYFVDIEKALYSGDCTDEEIRQLVLKERELFDVKLQEANEEERLLISSKSSVDAFLAAKKKITSITVAGSNNVDTFQEDGSEWARISCTYFTMEERVPKSSVRVCLLRRDGDRRWKIYGWKLETDVNVPKE